MSNLPCDVFTSVRKLTFKDECPQNVGGVLCTHTRTQPCYYLLYIKLFEVFRWVRFVKLIKCSKYLWCQKKLLVVSWVTTCGLLLPVLNSNRVVFLCEVMLVGTFVSNYFDKFELTSKRKNSIVLFTESGHFRVSLISLLFAKFGQNISCSLVTESSRQRIPRSSTENVALSFIYSSLDCLYDKPGTCTVLLTLFTCFSHPQISM